MNNSPPNSEPSEDAAARGSWQKSFQIAAPYMGLGVQMVLTMVFFAGGGYYLDRWLGTAPWLLLVGALIGAVSVLAYLVRLASQLGNPSTPRSTSDRDESSGDFLEPHP